MLEPGRQGGPASQFLAAGRGRSGRRASADVTADDPAGGREPSAQHQVTVVVITRDRREELGRTLSHLGGLSERSPIVVVDNGSVDGTLEMVRAGYPEVRLVALGSNLGAAGRNVGVALASTPYVAFCDDDTWWSSGSLGAAAALLDASPRLAVVTARIVVEPDGEVDPMCTEMAASPLSRPDNLPGAPLLSFLAGASVVRRSAFVAAGGFEPRLLIGGEEELLATDLAESGWAMAYVPDLEIHHYASRLRDPHLRRRQGIRNTLWHTWLRRPAGSAGRRSRALVATLPRDRVSAAAVLDAVRGARWVAANRRPVSPAVEAGLRVLEAGQRRSQARRYVS